MAQRSYKETLDFLFSQLPMFQRIGPAAFKKDLTNTLALCQALGNPQDKIRSLHIAGTNGKGSTAHMLSAVLQAAGYKVGLYTSPHYRDFRERIKINGELVPEQYVVDFVSAHERLFDLIAPSFFEITVAMAFDYFARQQVDWAVVEVGLGGRLDSTNVLLPELCVITNISYDHQQFLGDTLPAIAGEKAGIIKPGVPVVISETQAETEAVFLAQAERQGAPIIFADQHYLAQERERSFEHTVYDVLKDGALRYKNLDLNAYGQYQQQNLQAVLQAVEWLPKQARVGEAELREGLSKLRSLTRFMGRWQVLGHSPLVLCDSAHNEAGLNLAMQELARQSATGLHIVFGMVNDKSPAKLLQHLPKTARYYFARPDIPRGLSETLLQTAAEGFGLQGAAYPSVAVALKAAREHAAPDEIIFVGGSIFIVAEVV